MKLFRMGWFGLVAIASVTAIGFVSPPQLSVLLLKLAEVTAAAYAGYWIDGHAFIVAEQDVIDNLGVVMIRRAIIIGATLIAVAIAL